MKANELQINNWVMYGNRYAIVKSIEPNRVKILVSVGNGNDEIISETYDNIEPITLTPEILKKNRFEEEVNIKYVHQLQNSLRLTGIEKEIVI